MSNQQIETPNIDLVGGVSKTENLVPSHHEDEQIENIDIGIDATTLPPVDFRKEILDSSDEMFKNIEAYLSAEIDGKQWSFFSDHFTS